FRRVLGWRPFTFVGKYSYGLYVFHFILLPYLALGIPRTAIVRALGSQRAALGVSIAASILITLALAIASYELIEKRSLRLKTRFGACPIRSLLPTNPWRRRRSPLRARSTFPP